MLRGILPIRRSFQRIMLDRAFRFAYFTVLMFLFVAPLMAQGTGDTPAPPLIGQTIYTPGIHIGSASPASTMSLPRMEEPVPNAPEATARGALPADTALLATRHFDYIISPLDEIIPGSMEDSSMSLGDYARQLRAEKQRRLLPTDPASIANPASLK